jgi:hypothetical protein
MSGVCEESERVGQETADRLDDQQRSREDKSDAKTSYRRIMDVQMAAVRVVVGIAKSMLCMDMRPNVPR